jgi:hypothetical protein
MIESSPRGVLRVGDLVRFDGREQLVVGLAGTMVRLQDAHGGAALVLFSHLVAAEDFELLGAQPTAVPLPPFGMLDTVPGPVLVRAQAWERHLIEVETAPRPEYDPRWRNLSERTAAKAAELTAAGTPASTKPPTALQERPPGMWMFRERHCGRPPSRLYDPLCSQQRMPQRQRKARHVGGCG